jgi:hypothetical protein
MEQENRMKKTEASPRRRLLGIRDVLIILGTASVAAGLALIYVPAAFIVVGAGLIFLGVR